MPLYPVIVVGLLALVSLATLIGAARQADGGRGTRPGEFDPWPPPDPAEHTGKHRRQAIERVLVPPDSRRQCLPPPSHRCPRCGCPLHPAR